MTEDSDLERHRLAGERLERHRLAGERLANLELEDVIQHRLRVNREIGFDRGVSVICSLLMQLGHHALAMEYVANLMATPLGEKLANMTYAEREVIIRALEPTTGKERQ